MDKVLIIQSWDCSSHPYIYLFLIFGLPEMDLGECQSVLDLYPTHGHFIKAYALIPLLSVIFALLHETICILQ